MASDSFLYMKSGGWMIVIEWKYIEGEMIIIVQHMWVSTQKE